MFAVTLKEVSSAVQQIGWVLIAGLVIWRLFPAIKRLVSARGFTIKAGQFEFTAQEWSNEVLKSTAETQLSIGELANDLDELKRMLPAPIVESRVPEELPHAILWVGDQPENNRYEIAQIESLGSRVLMERSNGDAIAFLGRSYVDLVVTGASRTEAGTFNPDAASALVRSMRSSGFQQPVIIYSSGTLQPSLLNDPATAIATSPTRLFSLIGIPLAARDKGPTQ